MSIRSNLIALSLIAATAVPAAGQEAMRSNLSGLSLGVHLSGAAIEFDDDGSQRDSGGGLGLRFGYGFTPAIEAILEMQAARIGGSDGDEDYTLVNVDLGARYNFLGTASAVRPFVGVAVNSRQMSSKLEGETVDARGFGGSVSGGVHYFFRPNLSVEGALTYTGGSFSEMKVGNGKWEDLPSAVDAGSTRFDVGISWRR